MAGNRDDVASAIRDIFTIPNVPDSNLEAANLVDVIADMSSSISGALHALGNNRAATSTGALEAHGLKIYDGMELVASAISGLADAVGDLADAVRSNKSARADRGGASDGGRGEG